MGKSDSHRSNTRMTQVTYTDKFILFSMPPSWKGVNNASIQGQQDKYILLQILLHGLHRTAQTETKEGL